MLTSTPLFSAMDHHHHHQVREGELRVLLPTAPMPRVDGATTFFPAQLASPADHPQLDLSLSIRIGPPPAPGPAPMAPMPTPPAPAPLAAGQKKRAADNDSDDVLALKQQAAEQARLASAERAYAERVMELARRELELAEREFARARAIWERARGEVHKVERMKEVAAARRISAAALEITCHACMQRFH
ncbi:hypothetical protein GUJ93_ZPchr0006g42172 [Zizania palustris]|uniref:Uncharacterized protein n=1 Tax=Zizania palustris TaxID=103762 RepID=A0A8J5S918_ZIZPA|nr:hypothetical protein GUJ93_ZPchr0006g42172 [Zizania palustris]